MAHLLIGAASGLGCSYDDKLAADSAECRKGIPKKLGNFAELGSNRAMVVIHEFGPFRLDSEAEILFRGADPVRLGRRAVALLRVLVDRPGMPISKDALIEAAWPGLAVEDSNLTVQIGALRRALGEEPEGERWIETLPRRGYRFVGPAVTRSEAGAPATAIAQPDAKPSSMMAPALPDKPSIAVLPFQNLSGDADQEYFCDGIVEDIITALSRTRRLLVIARNSTFTYKGRTVDVKDIGRELGVRYVLEGSVQKAHNRVRITAQLIDASTGVHLWAERFDSALEDIFELQDQVTARVVIAITPKLERAEIERAKRKPTESLDAYDYFLRGLASFYRGTRNALSDALELFEKAIAIDPEFTSAYGMAAWCYVQRKNNGWMIDRVRETAAAERLAWHAARFGKDDPIALYAGGWALARIEGQLDAGAAMIDRALTLDPNLAAAWHSSGWVRIYLGEPEAAIEHIEHAMRLSPLDPLFFGMLNGMAAAHFLAGRYEEASSWAEKALRDHPNYLPALRMSAASNAFTGRRTNAEKAMARMRQFDPALRVSGLKDVVPFRGPEDFARYAEGLRIAGLPD